MLVIGDSPEPIVAPITRIRSSLTGIAEQGRGIAFVRVQSFGGRRSADRTPFKQETTGYV